MNALVNKLHARHHQRDHLRGSLTRVVCSLVSFMMITPFVSQEVNAEPTEAQIERAQDLILSARKSAAKGEYREAIRSFEEANDLVGSPDNLFAIASIYERIEGACEQSVNSWGRFLKVCDQCSLRQRGERRAQLLNAQCKVKLTVDSRPVGARVSLNGEERGLTPITIEMFAGKHRLNLSLSGYHPVQRSIFLLKGSKTEMTSVTMSPSTLQAPLSTAAAQVTRTPPPKETKPTASLSTSSSATLPSKERRGISGTDWAIIGTGAALTALGAWSYLSARAEVEEINSAQSVRALNEAQRDSSYQLKEGIGYIGMGVGVGLSAYGILRVRF